MIHKKVLLSRNQSNFWDFCRRQKVKKNLFYKLLVIMLCFWATLVLVQWDFFFGTEEVPFFLFLSHSSSRLIILIFFLYIFSCWTFPKRIFSSKKSESIWQKRAILLHQYLRWYFTSHTACHIHKFISIKQMINF